MFVTKGIIFSDLGFMADLTAPVLMAVSVLNDVVVALRSLSTVEFLISLGLLGLLMLQEGQHLLTGQRAANFRLPANQ